MKFWDLTDRAGPRRVGPPMIVAGHTDTVFAMAFSPDAHILATGGKDGITILWDLAGRNSLRDGVTERVCAITGGGLDRDEWARYIPGLPYEDTCPT